jgi:hypothetical protein
VGERDNFQRIEGDCEIKRKLQKNLTMHLRRNKVEICFYKALYKLEKIMPTDERKLTSSGQQKSGKSNTWQ